MKYVLIYDPVKNQWQRQGVNAMNGYYPSTTSDHVAVVSKFILIFTCITSFKLSTIFFLLDSNDQIIIFGGKNKCRYIYRDRHQI